MVLRAWLMAESTFLAGGLLNHAGAQYLAAEKTRACVEICSVLGSTRKYQLDVGQVRDLCLL